MKLSEMFDRYKIGMPPDKGGSMTVLKITKNDESIVKSYFGDWRNHNKVYETKDHIDFARKAGINTKWFAITDAKEDETQVLVKFLPNSMSKEEFELLGFVQARPSKVKGFYYYKTELDKDKIKEILKNSKTQWKFD